LTTFATLAAAETYCAAWYRSTSAAPAHLSRQDDRCSGAIIGGCEEYVRRSKLRRYLAELQEYIAQKTIASPTAASKVSHVTIVGAVAKPKFATNPVAYIAGCKKRVDKAREYRRTLCRAAATYTVCTRGTVSSAVVLAKR
jgi:hypothetical protein